MITNLPAKLETEIRPPGWKDPLGGGNDEPLQYPCLEKSHGQRSLAGYSQWGRKRDGRDFVTKPQCSSEGLPWWPSG